MGRLYGYLYSTMDEVRNVAKSKYDDLVQPKLKLVEAWARDGLTLDQIAHNLGISMNTLLKYRDEHSAFSEALKRGKDDADVDVENSLYKRANGYDYEEVTQELVDGVLTVTKVVTKQVAPDVTAQIFWLKNRRHDKWRDRRETELSGPDGQPLQVLFPNMPRPNRNNNQTPGTS